MNESLTPLTDAKVSALTNCQDEDARYKLAEFARGLEREAARLKAAIIEHHSQKADDRCIEDDDRLYAAARLPPCDRRVGSKESMLANCARFIERRCEAGGWKSYAELEREISRLTRAREAWNRAYHLEKEKNRSLQVLLVEALSGLKTEGSCER